MKGGLPDFVDPNRLAETRARLSGELPLARLARLAPLLCSGEGAITVDIEFGVDEQCRHVVHLRASGGLPMMCQRCVQPMSVPISVDAVLVVVQSESEAAQLDDRYDPLIVSGGKTSVIDLVEDELMLQLPMIPRHAGGERCAGQRPRDETQAVPRDNPFAVLAKLREKK